ncbi:MAG: 30S ribosomal protein S17e [Candidatus Bathyarchaeota archaeon]|nr:30S ribosomal protein S17e [Candidatus Bathyarchaeota archaeon]MDH5495082.1 30S ribosomal protein S17e [Candidatus Bathyarchaeota archaeon]
MGKVRPEHVKKSARELVALYPDKFSTDFQNNKKVVESLAQISSAKLRNRIAGYITRLKSIAHAGEAEEGAEEEEE